MASARCDPRATSCDADHGPEPQNTVKKLTLRLPDSRPGFAPGIRARDSRPGFAHGIRARTEGRRAGLRLRTAAGGVKSGTAGISINIWRVAGSSCFDCALTDTEPKKGGAAKRGRGQRLRWRRWRVNSPERGLARNLFPRLANATVLHLRLLRTHSQEGSHVDEVLHCQAI